MTEIKQTEVTKDDTTQPPPSEPAADNAPGSQETAEETAGEPEGSRFVINVDKKVEAIKPVDEMEPVGMDQLSPKARQALDAAGWADLMPVQSKAMPYFLAGQDLMVQSRTGSGKTGAFILPMLDELEKSKGAGQALILVPTRELATQVAGEAAMLGKPFGLRSIAVYGGVGYGPQIEAFEDGVEIIVATPGRLLDHLLKKHLTLDAISFLIFDEADRMLSMGFLPDMKAVRSYLPRKKLVHTYMFSATFPGDVLSLAYTFMREPRLLSLSRDHVHVTDNSHQFYVVPHVKRGAALATIADYENPSSAIVFCNRKDDVAYVSVVLAKYGFLVDQISSDLSQIAREKVMARLRKGDIRMLVATDVAARGIDIPEISHVFQYGAPEDPESYIHRSGRTGRAGASGTAITILSEAERLTFGKVIKKYDIDFEECELPSHESISMVMGERVVAKMEARFRALTRHEQDNVDRLFPFAKELTESEEGLRLIAMALNDAYQDAFRKGTPKNVKTPTSQQRGGRDGGRGRHGSGRSGRSRDSRDRRDRGQRRDRGERRDRSNRRGGPRRDSGHGGRGRSSGPSSKA